VEIVRRAGRFGKQRREFASRARFGGGRAITTPTEIGVEFCNLPLSPQRLLNG
jgi:hypothetical protein